MKKSVKPALLFVGLTLWAFLIFGQNAAQKSADLDKRMIELDYGTYSSQLNVISGSFLETLTKDRVIWRTGEGRPYQALFNKDIKKNLIIFG